MIKIWLVDAIWTVLGLVLIRDGLNGIAARRITVWHGAVMSWLLGQQRRTATHTGRDAIFWSVITILLGCLCVFLALYPFPR